MRLPASNLSVLTDITTSLRVIFDRLAASASPKSGKWELNLKIVSWGRACSRFKTIAGADAPPPFGIPHFAGWTLRSARFVDVHERLLPFSVQTTRMRIGLTSDIADHSDTKLTNRAR